MKKLFTNFLVQLNYEHLENLTSVVNETIATGYNPQKPKTFTAAELWNIQRQGKRRIQRRIFL